MRLLNKAISLVRRCELSERRSEASIGYLQQKINDLESRIAALDTQGELLQRMSHQQQAPGVINRAGMFARLQRSAVCREKLQTLALQRVQLQEQRALLLQEQ